MAIITKTFNYSGTLRVSHIEIPVGTTELAVYLWGGGGGSGGADASGPGSSGGAGHFVSRTGIDMTSYAGVKYIAIAVGGGGGTGQTGAEAAGGGNGKSITGYSGGVGGQSGPDDPSGSGAGGGGATVVTLFESGQVPNNIELAIAGGGGGAGGGGRSSRGGEGINANDATSNTPGTLGENGAHHDGQGGGGGAGGGGDDGGKGGRGAVGDAGGHGGTAGSSLIPAGGDSVSNAGSGREPHAQGNAHYSTGVAMGGFEGNAGGDGKAVLVFNIPAEGKFKVGSEWKGLSSIHTKVSGLWKKMTGGYYKVGGVWKAIWASEVTFINNAFFGDQTGGVTSGATGTGGTPTVANIPSNAPNIPGDGGGGNLCPHPLTKIDYTSADDGHEAFDPWSPASGTCFVAGTKVKMADGTEKNIEDVVVGDVVKGHNGDNTVIKLDWTTLGDRKLYTFNDSEHYFFTSEHPFMTEEGWKSVKPEKTKERDGVELYNQLKGALEVGDKLVTGNGLFEITDIKSKEMNDSEMPLYNFHISNDKSYIADNYVVHNKGCFLAGTLVTMADGSTKPIEEIEIEDTVAVGGFVFAVGKFLINDLHDYKGIKVSGSHMVKEDGEWKSVSDSKHGKLINQGNNIVYIFGCENRRIQIKDTLFTDYFDGFAQEGLKALGEKYFAEWREHADVTEKEIVDISDKS
jgi:hypothetical protein